MTKGTALYIHIPFCRSKCSYCDFFSRPGIEKYLDSYVEALCSQIKFFAEKFDSYKKVSTVYIGGGTPSLLSISQLSEIFSSIQNNFQLENVEATLELNPDDVTEELLSFLENSFINRISVGIQSLKQNVLTAMNRRASRNVSLNALKLISEKFSKRFSCDLIAGFPGETENDLFENIDELLKYKPEHISLYSLCVEEGTCLYRQIDDGTLDFDQGLSDELWLSGKTYLESKGFSQYEISNFAVNEKCQSRHNLNYWNLNTYLGFGSGGTGTIFLKKTDSIRYANSQDIIEYIDFWTDSSNIAKLKSEKNIEKLLNLIPGDVEIIDKETEEFEFLMMNFRLVKGCSSVAYKERFGKDLAERLGKDNGLFKNWVEKGDAEIEGEYFSLTEKGLLYLNSFLEELIEVKKNV